MITIQRLALAATGLGLATIPFLLSAQAAPTQKIAGHTLIAADELKWAPAPGLEGVMQAPAFGDPTKEAHRVFYKFPVGMKAPLHTHTSGDRGVILSGTLGLAVEGAPMKKLGPGSFFQMAGGTKHVTTVEGDAPCVFYVEREGPFDIVMAEEAGAKKDAGGAKKK
jgi:quercetin dioxygenase-like cupin family protein